MNKASLLLICVLGLTIPGFSQFGIGTTNPNPSTKLEVYDGKVLFNTNPGSNWMEFELGELNIYSPNDGVAAITLNAEGNAWKVGKVYNTSNNFFIWKLLMTGGIPFSINENGYVGIGTSNAQNQLHVTTNFNPLRLNGLQTNNENEMLVISSSGIVFKKQIGWDIIGNTLSGSEFLGSTNNQPVRMFSNNTERMRISESGNIGIGVTNPGSLFTIGNNVPGAGVTNNSWLSIGTSGSKTIAGVVIGNDVTSSNYIAMYWNPSFAFGSIQTASSSQPLLFQHDHSGKVGIGTSLPKTRLDVSGDVAYRSNTLSLSSGTYNNLNTGSYSYIRITSSNNFSITGFTGGYDGKILIVHNVNNNTMSLINESTSSDAGNRIHTNTGGAINTSGEGSVTLIYSGPDSRWIAISVWE